MQHRLSCAHSCLFFRCVFRNHHQRAIVHVSARIDPHRFSKNVRLLHLLSPIILHCASFRLIGVLSFEFRVRIIMLLDNHHKYNVFHFTCRLSINFTATQLTRAKINAAAFSMLVELCSL